MLPAQKYTFNIEACKKVGAELAKRARNREAERAARQRDTNPRWGMLRALRDVNALFVIEQKELCVPVRFGGPRFPDSCGLGAEIPDSPGS